VKAVCTTYTMVELHSNEPFGWTCRAGGLGNA